ncbi:MAG: PilT/PilU family type 4a pilus ATPase [Candidatus Acidiferrales bacterium]
MSKNSPVPSSSPDAPQNHVMMSTPTIISAMLKSAPHISDLIFSPGKLPQVESSGNLVGVRIPGGGILSPEDTARIAADLIGGSKLAVEKLREEGSCDISYSLPKLSRFRVNIFTQRGTCAIVMRVIPSKVPDFTELNLPPQMQELTTLQNGIVLVTGPAGSGKSSTLAAVLNKINEDQAVHVLTIEDPIEFIHPHKKATIHQRELHSDTPSFALALRAALRQAPKVILVGEMRDRETIEIAMEAGETGHLVFSTLHTIDASKTIERVVGAFPVSEQYVVRMRFAKTFRYIISQRLLPRKDGEGRIPAIEILKSTMRTREYIEKGEGEGKSLIDAMRDGSTEGMQCFDGELERLVRTGMIDLKMAIAYASNAGNLRLQLADFAEPPAPPPEEISAAPEMAKAPLDEVEVKQ